MNVYALELTRLPNASLKVLQRLAKTLLRDQAEPGSAAIEAAAARLKAIVARVHAALIARMIADNPKLQASEASFDRAVDGLWLLLRRALEDRAAFAHPGLDALPAPLAEQGQLAARREEARLAGQLWSRLFAAEGTQFIKSRFITQAESMATLLGLIEQEQLRAQLDAVLGEGLMQLIEACQQHYEDMVDGRLSREQGAREDFRELSRELRWAIVAYVHAVHTLYDPEDPESEQRVLDALRPILVLREELARSPSTVEPTLASFEELELPEAEANQPGEHEGPEAESA